MKKFLLIVFLIFPTISMAMNGDTCKSSWRHSLNELENVYNSYDKAGAIIYRKPKAAYNRYIDIISQPNDFMDIYYDCRDVTNVTKTMATDMSDSLNKYIRLSQCASGIADITRSVLSIRTMIKKARRSPFPHRRKEELRNIKIKIESTIDRFKFYIDRPYCAGAPDLLKYIDTNLKFLYEAGNAFKPEES